jgi:hypothetical protein
MKITNKSERVVHFNVPGGPIALAPLATIELDGDQAAAAKQILDGPWKPLLDSGALLVDGPDAVNGPGTVGTAGTADPAQLASKLALDASLLEARARADADTRRAVEFAAQPSKLEPSKFEPDEPPARKHR